MILIEVYPLKYQKPIQEEFSFILQQGYCAWFSFSGSWARMETFRPDVHALPQNFGQKDAFMGNNLIIFPSEHPLAQSGPTGWH